MDAFIGIVAIIFAFGVFFLMTLAGWIANQDSENEGGVQS